MRREGVGHPQPLFGDAIDIRRREDGLGVVAARVTPTEVVG
jgi:hypothetical protein